MIKIRLKRMGAKKRPYYRIVVADVRTRPQGKYIEQIGIYHPLQDVVEVKKDIALKWLNNGAQVTPTVKNILSKCGVIKEFHAQKQAEKESHLAAKN